MHRVTNPAIVAVDGEVVRARSYIDALVSIPGDQVSRSAGIYHDQLRQTPEGWRIARRRFERIHAGFMAVGEVP